MQILTSKTKSKKATFILARDACAVMDGEWMINSLNYSQTVEYIQHFIDNNSAIKA